MRTLAVINQKGGVGKTTTAVNISASLAEMGQRVCLVDLDPQSHASLHLGMALDEGDPSIYDALIGRAELADIRTHVSENLSLIPAHLDLAAAELELASEVGREVILRDLIERDKEPFDLLMIDCPPSLGILTLNALTSVNEVLLPLQSHYLALHGLSKLLRTISVVSSRLNPQLKLTGVILSLFESGTRLSAEVSRDVESFFAEQSQTNQPWSDAQVFATRIRKNVRLAEAPSFGQSIFQYAPQSNGAEDYHKLAIELMATAPTASRSNTVQSAQH